jgi:iron-sulfur cluster assembly protein
VLTITPTASELIRQLVDASDVPDSAGVRIAAGEPTAHGTTLELALVVGPEPGDEVVNGGEASVFLEPEIAEDLDHTVLDAEVVGDGRIQFALRDDHGAGPTPSGRNGSTPD